MVKSKKEMKNNRSRFYLSLRKNVEKELLKWLKKLKLYPLITVDQLKKAVYQCKEKKEFEVFKPFLKKAKEINPKLSLEEIETFHFFLHNHFWNISSIKFLGGKSPFEMVEEMVIEDPKKNIFYHPVFTDITLPFKITVDEVINSIEDKNKKTRLISSLPLIFKRYWYSPMKEGDGESSPFLIFLKVANFYIPKIDFYSFPFYQKGEVIFEGFAVEEKNWNFFPIIFDLKAKGESCFYHFDDYRFIVRRVKKMNLPTDFNFFSYFIDFLLLQWKRLDPVIKNLSDRDWLMIWRKFLTKTANDVVDTEAIIYPVILLLRKWGFKVNFILDWIAQWPNIVKSKNPSDEEKAQDFFFFKLITDFDRFFITPLTLYLPVFNLLYGEKFSLDEEIRIFLSFNSEMVFYKPPTKLTFNEFGRRMFKSYYF